MFSILGLVRSLEHGVYENGTALELPRNVSERSMNTISISVLRVMLHATMVVAAIQDERVSVHEVGVCEITGTCVCVCV